MEKKITFLKIKCVLKNRVAGVLCCWIRISWYFYKLRLFARQSHCLIAYLFLHTLAYVVPLSFLTSPTPMFPISLVVQLRRLCFRFAFYSFNFTPLISHQNHDRRRCQTRSSEDEPPDCSEDSFLKNWYARSTCSILESLVYVFLGHGATFFVLQRTMLALLLNPPSSL